MYQHKRKHMYSNRNTVDDFPNCILFRHRPPKLWNRNISYYYHGDDDRDNHGNYGGRIFDFYTHNGPIRPDVSAQLPRKRPASLDNRLIHGIEHRFIIIYSF